MSETAEQRLGRYVRERRRALELGQGDLGPRGGPSPATVRLIERGEPVTLQRGTKAGLENALKWALGSVDRILEGLEPVRQARSDDDHTADQETVVPNDDDANVLGSLPPEALEGLSPADRAEVIAAAKLSALQTAREIRRRLDS